MKKRNYFIILFVFLLSILILLFVFMYKYNDPNYLNNVEYSHYFLNGNMRSGESFISGYAYKNNDELYLFLGQLSEPSTSNNKTYKYYRVDVFYNDNLIFSDENENVDLFNYWNNFKMFKKVDFVRNDFTLVLKVYDQKEGKSLYEKEIIIEQFV